MKIEVLVSTMNRKNSEENINLIKKMNIKGSSVTINQCPNSSFELKDKSYGKNKFFSYDEKGLSISRNNAIKKSDADICVIADDDLVYENDYESKIFEAYLKYSDADIIAFYVESLNKDRQTTTQEEGQKKFLGSMKIASFQITFKRKSIVDNKLVFDEKFGAGSGKFTAGEENIFLFDCLRKKMKIYYIPIKIAEVNHNDSTWFEGYNKKFFETKGAAFYRMSPFFSNLFILQYAIRKYVIYKNDIKLKEAIKYMKIGKKKVSFKTFFVGDFETNTGPAIVNANLKKSIRNNALYSCAKGKISRIIELFIKTVFSDCVFFCSFSKLNLIGIKVAKLFKKRTFYLMHGRIEKENSINKITDKNAAIIEDYILNNVDNIFCVSKLLANEVLAEGYKAKINYVYNGINYDNITVKKRIKKSKKMIMSTGGLMPLKNNLTICKAIEKINNDYNLNLEYLIIGNDYGKEKEINKYSFLKYIKSVDHKKCLEYMKKSNIYIQNSLYETFGLAVMESIVNGCNILISKNIGAKDILTAISDEDIIYNPNDIDEIVEKIMNLLDNSNNNRIKKNLNYETTNVNFRAKQLMNKIEELLYE